jgi:hypothetical protein
MIQSDNNTITDDSEITTDPTNSQRETPALCSERMG